MAKEYVPVYLDWLYVTQDLSAKDKGNLIDAVIAYASGIEYEHMLNSRSRIAFRFLKGQDVAKISPYTGHSFPIPYGRGRSV